MEELFQIIEEKLKAAGCPREVSGLDIYEEICDEIEDKDNGTYLFMSRQPDGAVFEYKVDVMDEQFNLCYIEVRSKDGCWHADFD